MSLPPLYIAFEHHQVEIATSIPDIHAILTLWFTAMLESQPTHIIKRVEITSTADGYFMQAGETVQEMIREELWLLQAVKYEVVTGLIAARPDLLWFHAGAVADDRGAIVVAGAGGSGKSTLVTQLYQQGWHYLSDDVIPLDLATGKLLPFPQTPRVRQNTGELVPLDRLAEVPKVEVRLERDRVCQAAIPIQAIIFANYSPATAHFSPCSAGTAALELLRNCLNFLEHKQVAMQRVSELVRQVLVFQAAFNQADEAIAYLKAELQFGTDRLKPVEGRASKQGK